MESANTVDSGDIVGGEYIIESSSQLALEWLRSAVEAKASDLSIGAGRRVTFKINGVLIPQGDSIVRPHDAETLVTGLYELAYRSMDRFKECGDDDFLVIVPDLARFRVNTYRQRNTYAAAIRVVLFEIPNYRKIHIPDDIMSLANETDGIALVTGPSGSGKSTTLACIIDAINKTRNVHVITLEDPIEFLHKDKKAYLSQREIHTDTESYIVGLRATLRQSPDVILLGEMRDQETIKTAITAAETGHFVLSTLHTIGSANTIDRIIDNFPPGGQQQVRVQLSQSLRMVISQRLLFGASGELIPTFEIMRVNTAISNMIREGKTHQIDSALQTGSGKGMIDMDTYIIGLYRDRLITKDVAIKAASDPEHMMDQVNKF